MLKLDAMICRFGKISNNLECHGDDYVTEFNIPVSGVMLTAEQLNDFIGDPYCDKSWFNTTKAKLKEPMAWWERGDFRLKDSLEADACTVKVSGDRQLEFERKDELPACRISRMTLRPQVGGMTELSFQLQVRPGIGKTNLILQEHQNREVRLTVGDAKLVTKSKQQALPLGAAEDGDDSEKPDAGDGDAFAAAAKAQVDAFKRGRRRKNGHTEAQA